MNDYDIVIVALPEEDGGGFACIVPDLPGCISDGETRAEAIANIEGAIQEWIATQRERGLPIPERGSHSRRQKEENHKMTRQIREALKNLEAEEVSDNFSHFPASFRSEIPAVLENSR